MQASETMRQVSFAPLLRASEGLTQWRPMALGFLTWVVVALLLAVGGFLSSSIGGAAGVGLMGLFGLLTMILIAAGMSGVGILLMDKAKNIAPRSMMDAADSSPSATFVQCTESAWKLSRCKCCA